MFVYNIYLDGIPRAILYVSYTPLPRVNGATYVGQELNEVEDNQVFCSETIITVCHWTFARPNGMFVRQ